MSHRLTTPPPKHPHGPVAFWFLNGQPIQAELDRQLAELAAQRFGGVVLHPRDGMATLYLSESWFKLIDWLTERATHHGLAVWFYDENPFPSGTAGGLLLDRHPHLAGQTLQHRTQRVTTDAHGRLRIPLQGVRRLLAVYAAPADGLGRAAGPFVNVTDHAGLHQDGWYVQGPRTRGYGPAYRDDTCDEHWRAWVQGESWMIDWQAPAPGEHLLLIVWRTTQADSRHGLYVDLMHPQTGRQFIEMTHQQTLDRLGASRFAQFACVFIDEPRLCSPWPWTDDLPRQYHLRQGRDWLADLPALLLGHDDHAQEVRHAYRATLADLWIERFWRPLKQWCVEHDLPLTGHLSPEEDPLYQQSNNPGWPIITGMMDWPGCDQIASYMGVGDHAFRSLSPKLTSSLAHQQGRDHVMVETLGVTGEGFTLERMKRMIDWLAVCGCDTFVLHGQYMSVAGHRKREAPPSIFVQQPYWPFVGLLADHIADWRAWQQTSRPDRPVALVYPVTHFQAVAGLPDGQDVPIARKLGDLAGQLMAWGIDYDLVADHDLAGATWDDQNRLHVGQAVYDTLVLPEMRWVDAQAMPLLRQAGEALLSLTRQVQTLPTRDTQAFDGLDVAALKAALIARHRAWLQVDDPQQAMYVHSRRDAKGSLHRTLWNPGDEPVTVRVHHAGAPVALTLAPWSLERLTWHADGRLAQPASACAASPRTPSACLPLKITDWQVEPETPNTVRLGRWRLRRSAEAADQPIDVPCPNPLWPSPEAPPESTPEATPTANGHANAITLATTFHCDQTMAGLTLVIDQEAMAQPPQATLDGQVLDLALARPSAWPDSLELPLPDLAAGEHELALAFPEAVYAACPLRDPLYLAGWLTHTLHQGDTPPRLSPARWPAALPGDTDWTTWGLPHYSGVVRYHARVEVPHDATTLQFIWPRPQGDPFELLIDGRSVGRWLSAQGTITLPVTLSAGGHDLTLRVANTRINFVEGIAQPSGLAALPGVAAVS